jgi:hypothetical protein
MSSSPWEWLWNGDEDVATPFHVGAVSRCAPARAPRFASGRRICDAPLQTEVKADGKADWGTGTGESLLGGPPDQLATGNFGNWETGNCPSTASLPRLLRLAGDWQPATGNRRLRPPHAAISWGRWQVLSGVYGVDGV